MTTKPAFDRDYAARQFRRRRNPLRRAIKYFYLRNMLREVRGRTVDLGFGAGQLLERLPAGSIGLEVNPHLVDDARRAGLNAVLYDSNAEQPLIGVIPAGAYSTLVMAHVLEHFEHAAGFLRRLLRSCAALGIESDRGGARVEGLWLRPHAPHLRHPALPGGPRSAVSRGLRPEQNAVLPRQSGVDRAILRVPRVHVCIRTRAVNAPARLRSQAKRPWWAAVDGHQHQERRHPQRHQPEEATVRELGAQRRLHRRDVAQE